MLRTTLVASLSSFALVAAKGSTIYPQVKTTGGLPFCSLDSVHRNVPLLARHMAISRPSRLTRPSIPKPASPRRSFPVTMKPECAHHPSLPRLEAQRCPGPLQLDQERRQARTHKCVALHRTTLTRTHLPVTRTPVKKVDAQGKFITAGYSGNDCWWSASRS